MADGDLTERVLTVVDQVPSGNVVTYGDIAGLVGTGPRQVGAIMASEGSGVAWWRVVRADGTLPAQLVDRARPHWRREDIAVADHGRGCRIRAHRADLAALADRVDEALATLGLPVPGDQGSSYSGTSRYQASRQSSQR